MEPSTLIVLVLSVGFLALLVWFEINSRRNDQKKKNSPHSESGARSEAETDKIKAA